MDEDRDFIVRMTKNSIFYAIILFISSLVSLYYDISFIIPSFFWALVFSAIGGLELIIAIDWYYDGKSARPFSLLTLYLIGIMLGLIIFFLVICNIPTDIFTQIQSILNIQAIR